MTYLLKNGKFIIMGKEKRVIDFQPINLKPLLMSIDLPDKNVRVGTALFLHNGVDGAIGKQAILWHLFVKKEYRRNRFATNMLSGAKQLFNEILTDWESVSGLKMCIANDFKQRKSDTMRLVWRKGFDGKKGHAEEDINV